MSDDRLPAITIHTPGVPKPKILQVVSNSTLQPFDMFEQTGIPTVRPSGYYQHETEEESFLMELEDVCEFKRRLDDQDMHMSLEMNLREMLYTEENTDKNKKLKKQVKNVLKDFLKLADAAAVDSLRMKHMLKTIKDEFDDVTTSRTNLLSTLTSTEHPLKDWSTDCSLTTDGGSATLCGMWKLLFRMGLSSKASPYGFAKTIHKYSQTIGFACAKSDEQCNAIFHRDPKFDKSLGSTDQILIWLAELRHDLQHLLMERRMSLVKKPVGETEAQWAEFPHRDDCRQCWTGSDSNINNNKKTPYRPSGWNTKMVIQYIRLEYSQDFAWAKILPMYNELYPFGESEQETTTAPPPQDTASQDVEEEEPVVDDEEYQKLMGELKGTGDEEEPKVEEFFDPDEIQPSDDMMEIDGEFFQESDTYELEDDLPIGSIDADGLRVVSMEEFVELSDPNDISVVGGGVKLDNGDDDDEDAGNVEYEEIEGHFEHLPEGTPIPDDDDEDEDIAETAAGESSPTGTPTLHEEL